MVTRTETVDELIVKLSIIIDGIGEGNGNPLQYSCLENPMDKETW